MKKRITITEADIAFGKPGHSWECALVLTLARTFPGLKAQVCSVMLPDGTMGHEVRLHETVGTIDPTYEIVDIFRLSKNASSWITLFDTVGVGEPATFEMTKVEL